MAEKIISIADFNLLAELWSQMPPIFPMVEEATEDSRKSAATVTITGEMVLSGS
jgi:hypothetical protein